MSYDEIDPNWKPEWLIEGLVEAHQFNVFSGSEKSHKSMLRKYLVCCMITGQKPFGLLNVTSSPPEVLSMIAEDAPGAERRVYDIILKEMGYKDLPPIHMVDPDDFDLSNDRDVTDLTELVMDLRIDLVCLDPLIEFHSRNENLPDQKEGMKPVIKGLRRVMKATGATTMVIHHNRKPFQVPGKAQTGNEHRDPGADMRGSSIVPAAAHCLTGVYRHGRSFSHTLWRKTKNADDSEPYKVLVDPTTWLWELDEPITEAKVYNKLMKNPGTTYKGLARLMAKRTEDVRGLLAGLEKKGLAYWEPGQKGRHEWSGLAK